jgi:hypothetical protein
MEQKEDIFKYGLKGGHHEPEVKEIHLEKIIKKIAMPLFIIIVLAAVFLSGYYVKKCPVCETCKVCEECQTCPELDCNDCPKQTEKVTVIKYACSNGLIVDNLDKCNPLNYVKIQTPYKETNNGVTLSIDSIEYEKNSDYNKITKISYTIVNSNEHEIKPIILVNIYSEDQAKADQGLVHEVFDDDEYVMPDAWVSKKKDTNIGFKGESINLRLVLKDKLPDPDQELVRTTRPLEVI